MSVLKEAIHRALIGPVETTSQGQIGAAFRFESSFIGFSGHFPGHPLLPAFVQVLLAVTTIEESKGLPVTITSLDNAKFQKEVHPGDTVTVQCNPLSESPLLSFRIRMTSGQDPVASYTITCRKDLENE